ncbi:hypothetical protein [Streptomyces sp. NBC_00986]|uniref:hypothetical protein n=1 Tax=Streptomyces sp. NBC_00986 TaxID=2903702 RepID=UPI003867AA3F|nr:hypothetical protein OG504_25880 [Streptomyces sp. NBC_00986]
MTSPTSPSTTRASATSASAWSTASTTTPNAAFTDLAGRVDAAVTPLETPAPNPASHPFDAATYRAHLSLVSHDMYVRPDLFEEVRDYVLGLPVPSAFPGDTGHTWRLAR